MQKNKTVKDSGNTAVIILVLIAIVVVVLVLAGSKKEEMVVNNEEAMMQEKTEEVAGGDAMESKDDGVMMEGGDTSMQTDGAVMEEKAMMKGSYETYAPEKLARAAAGDVVLFFRASWCPTCRTLDADIRANAGAIPENVTILDVNYDTATALKQKYGVTYQHTLVQVDAAGNQIVKWSGSSTLADILKNIK